MRKSQNDLQNSQAGLAMQSAKTPQVSIIVPIYNVANYLKECLQSIVKQSYENLDIILVDDGSSDESLEIALNFAKKDERIFVASKPNGGLSSARNTGLEFVKGSALRGFCQRQNDEKNSPSLAEGDKGGGYDFVPNLKNANSIYPNSTLPLTPSAREGEIKSLTQTHFFDKTTKTINAQEINAHFTQIQPNFIKSDLERINDFITQELPQNALIHFVDSDDYIEQNCIEKCVQNLLDKDLDIIAHNLKEFDENTKEFKQGSYLNKLKKNDYSTGLELLSDNKIYDFYFAWQGLFKADILNRYALRFTEGIYHEDHDFGTLLFCLANKVAYINEPFYIYRHRATSITGAQKNKAMPEKLPSFLEPLRADFKDYKALRGYFKDYCAVVVASALWDFYQINKIQKKYFKKQVQRYVKSYIDNFYQAQHFYTQKASQMLAQMGYENLKFWHFYFFIRSYFRNPKKFLRIFSPKKVK